MGKSKELNRVFIKSMIKLAIIAIAYFAIRTVVLRVDNSIVYFLWSIVGTPVFTIMCFAVQINYLLKSGKITKKYEQDNRLS